MSQLSHRTIPREIKMRRGFNRQCWNYRTVKELVRRSMIPILFLYLSLGCTLVFAKEIIVMGDSWAEPIGRALQEVLLENQTEEITVHTTPYWGGPRNLDSPEGRAAISEWLETWPDANLIYMMMGQNNWLCCWNTSMIGTQEESELFLSIVTHTEAVVDYMLTIRPGLQIVWTSGEYYRPHQKGTPTQLNANHDRLAELAAEFSQGRSELTFLNWNGLFQVTYGFDGVQYTPYDPATAIPPHDPSLPDTTLPSPYQAYPPERPAHPTGGGYRVMAQALYDQYFAAKLNGDTFYINPGLNDAWYNPATNGQGFLITVFPDIKQMFLAWFTYDTARPPEGVTAILGEPGHRWLTAQGPYSGDTANLTIYLTEGGVFDKAEPEASNDGIGDGTLTLEFADCSEALINYAITSIGISGEIPIQRIVPDNIPLCEALTNP